MVGGAGNDTYVVDDGGDVVTEEADGGVRDRVFTSLSSYTLAANTEILVGDSSSGQSLTGSSGSDEIYAGAGADTLAGGDGNDGLLGGAGTDTLQGGAGDDFVDGGAGADTLAGGSGHDTYVVDDSGDVVTEDADGGRDLVYTSLSSHTLAANIELLVGNSSSGQSLTGNSGNNEIYAGAGADTLDGGDGNDGLFGGAGTDTLQGEPGTTPCLGAMITTRCRGEPATMPSMAARVLINSFSLAFKMVETGSVILNRVRTRSTSAASTRSAGLRTTTPSPSSARPHSAARPESCATRRSMAPLRSMATWTATAPPTSRST